ncbi:hypothetical protein [Pelagibacterium sp.]|uniref:hypothetical protein n=1 Tax=Pelagibacterium sp. TaxID=1967288 RepID=UPI003BABBBFC
MSVGGASCSGAMANYIGSLPDYHRDEASSANWGIRELRCIPRAVRLVEVARERFRIVLDETQKRRTALHDLATAWWESGKTIQPAREAYWLSDWQKS